jgi:hypothetical protein
MAMEIHGGSGSPLEMQQFEPALVSNVTLVAPEGERA